MNRIRSASSPLTVNTANDEPPLHGKRFPFCLLSVIGLLTSMTLTPASAPGQTGPDVQTLRYDLPTGNLSDFGKEFVLDFFFPPVPAEIVNTRFNLTFETETAAGTFDAAKVGLILQPPIDDPLDPDDRVVTLFLTGEDFGWSGTGTFTFMGETDEANGTILDAPPNAAAFLYGVTLFHADRLTNPDDDSLLGGRFVASYIEVDYIVVPEPATGWLAVLCLVGAAAGRQVRRASGRS